MPAHINILVINAGSSSVKFTCFAKAGQKVLAKGMVERIGQHSSRLHYSASGGRDHHREIPISDTAHAVQALAECLTDAGMGVLQSPAEVGAVGHRVVHGGERLIRPLVIDHEVKQVIRDYFDLAPLHNPPNLAGIEAAENAFPNAVQVGVFDTAFHSDLPSQAYLYALPLNIYHQSKIRRYGFHGISHGYVARRAAEFMGRPQVELNLITCHLGNGCSITAVKEGVSHDTSMGFTPLEGLVMGTRCGDLDPAIVLYLMEKKGFTLEQIKQLLNKKSGLLGLSGGLSGDMRDLTQALERDNDDAMLALQVFCYRIKKYIGAYYAAMGSIHGLVFTGGIGENSELVRRISLDGLQEMGLVLDENLNRSSDQKVRYIQSQDSKIKIMVVPTDEEKEIASQVRMVVGGSSVC